MLGCLITTSMRKQCTLANARVDKANEALNNIIGAPVSAERKARAVIAKAVPTATYGSLWSTPCKAKLQAARSKTIRCLWGASGK